MAPAILRKHYGNTDNGENYLYHFRYSMNSAFKREESIGVSGLFSAFEILATSSKYFPFTILIIFTLVSNGERILLWDKAEGKHRAIRLVILILSNSFERLPA